MVAPLRIASLIAVFVKLCVAPPAGSGLVRDGMGSDAVLDDLEPDHQRHSHVTGRCPPILNEEIISMGVILSEKAANEVKRLITGQNLPEGTMLRIGVRGGRCAAVSPTA